MRASCLILVSLLAGCAEGAGLVRIVSRNFGAFFGTPAPVVPLHPPVFDARKKQVAVTWVGHATTVIQLDDRFVLTDPVFTATVGAVSRRIVAPAMRADVLPHIDAVIISHQHFDHLSFGSLDLVKPHAENLLVPAGTKTLLPEQHYNVFEMPWRSVYRDGDLRITAVPVKHVSGRFGLDASWHPQGFGGYLIEYRGYTIFYGGDTALSLEYARAAKELAGAPIDLALLPIAPANPRKLMQRTHVDADEALALFAALGARHMVAIHYDTFINSDDKYGAAAARVVELAAAAGLGDRVHVLSHGDQFVLPSQLP